MALERDAVIQRQVPQTTGKPHITYARVSKPLGVIGWIDRMEKASRFEYDVAAMLCHALNQQHEQTMVGPSYWVEVLR